MALQSLECEQRPLGTGLPLTSRIRDAKSTDSVTILSCAAVPACPAIVLQPYFTERRNIYAHTGTNSGLGRPMLPVIEHAYSRGLSNAEEIDAALQHFLLRQTADGQPVDLAVDDLCPTHPGVPAASLPDNATSKLEARVQAAKNVWNTHVNGSGATLNNESKLQAFLEDIVHPIGSVLASDLDLNVTGQRSVYCPRHTLARGQNWARGKFVHPDSLVLEGVDHHVDSEVVVAGEVKMTGEGKIQAVFPTISLTWAGHLPSGQPLRASWLSKSSLTTKGFDHKTPIRTSFDQSWRSKSGFSKVCGLAGWPHPSLAHGQSKTRIAALTQHLCPLPDAGFARGPVRDGPESHTKSR